MTGFKPKTWFVVVFRKPERTMFNMRSLELCRSVEKCPNEARPYGSMEHDLHPENHQAALMVFSLRCRSDVVSVVEV